MSATATRMQNSDSFSKSKCDNFMKVLIASQAFHLQMLRVVKIVYVNP